MQMSRLMTSYSKPNFFIKHINKAILVIFAVQAIEIWQTISSTGNTPTAVKNYIPMATP